MAWIGICAFRPTEMRKSYSSIGIYIPADRVGRLDREGTQMLEKLIAWYLATAAVVAALLWLQDRRDGS